MKKTNNKMATMVLLSALALPGLFSCAKKEYDLNNLNTEVTIAQEGLALPVGSTKQIKVKELLNKVGDDILSSDNNGLELSIADTMHLGEQLPDLREMLKFEDITIAQSFDFEIGDLDADKMSIDGMDITYDVFSGGNFNTEVTVPKISKDEIIKLGMWEYAAKIQDINLSSSLVDKTMSGSTTFILPKDVTIPPGVPKIEVSIPDQTQSISKQSSDITIKFDSPDAKIKNIKDIILGEGSKMTISLKVTGHDFIVKGNLTPDLTLSLGDLFTLKDQSGKNVDGTIKISDNLNSANNFAISKEFSLESINLTGTVPQTNTISVDGSFSLSDVKTDTDKLKTADGKISASVKISFDNVTVKSATFDISGVTINQEIEVPVSLGNGITLPDHISSIDKVLFTDDSSIGLNLTMKNINDKNLKINMKKLEISFPKGMSVKDAVEGTLTETDKDLSNGYSNSLFIQQISLPAPEKGVVKWDDKVIIKANVEINGTGINSANFPTTEAEDCAIETNAKSFLTISDWNATIESFENNIETYTKQVDQTIDGDISEFGTFTIYPQGNPAIRIAFNIPETKLQFVPSSEKGIVITFPEFIKFKNVNSEYNYDQSANSITLKNSIPDRMVLFIEKLVVSPQKTEEGKTAIKGTFTVDGSISVKGGTVSKGDVEVISGSTISASASIPAITAQRIAMEEFKIDLNQKFLATILQADKLPEDVKINEFTEALLDNVSAVFSIGLKGLPDMGDGKDLIAEISVNIPNELVLDQNDSRVNGNVLKIDGKFEKGVLAVDPIRINAINMSEYDFSSGEDLKKEISVSGKISVKDPNIDLSELKSSIQADIKASIKDIRFSSIRGKIEYNLENSSQVIKLEGLPDILKNEDVNLDIANPALKLKAITNMGIPVKGAVNIIPIRNGVKDEKGKISLNIAIDGSTDVNKDESVMYYIAASEKGKPAGYTFVKRENIRPLISHIPDELEIEFSAGTDGNKECYVVPDADYKFDIEYEFACPLAFGEDFEFTYTDTLKNVGAEFASILKGNTITIGGEVENQLPLALELSLGLLDDKDNIIPLETVPAQLIKSCSSTGEPVITPLELTLKAGKNLDLDKLNSILVSFKATSGDAAGVQLNEESYVQASLNLLLPEGINLDLKDFGNNK